MKMFRNLVKESPVGMVGRTGKEDAKNYIDNTDIEKEFAKIVKMLGGKEVARELLARMNNKGDVIKESKPRETPQSFLRSLGYKIKNEEPSKYGFEIEFFKTKDAENAKEELESAGFDKIYSISVNGSVLEYIKVKS